MLNIIDAGVEQGPGQQVCMSQLVIEQPRMLQGCLLVLSTQTQTISASVKLEGMTPMFLAMQALQIAYDTRHSMLHQDIS